MRHLRTAVAVLAAIAALGACTVAKPGTPKAGPSTRNIEEELGNTKESDLRKVFTSSPQQVNDYWNSDRLKNAKPRQPEPGQGTDVPKDEPAGVVVQPTSGPVGVTRPQPSDPSGAAWSRAGLSASTAGRLYYSFNGDPYVCSASVVNSTSGTLVATAAHCVWETTPGKKSWASDVLFIPGDTNRQAPYGRWTAEMMYAPKQFIDSADSAPGTTKGAGWAYDFAFLRMRPLNGRNIKDALGGQGIAFDARAESIRTLGYPTAPPFDGTTMRSCASPTYTTERSRNTYGIPCTMTPGCSGGGWFTRFDDEKGAGYLISVHSTGNGRQSNGPTLGKVAYDLYKQADSGA
ncbi:hypothetical protein NLX83_23515 [Allokutzneria sp. A3M-2-11 16]|uniref:trypsin-like serine peptidase n=1 Tax=Allokutzneria sp. A3M-2-11 16 TaxID=2962043 RepID=UPI0020B807B2|nr:hypothetical protein [Allokutzneria sp. A3M-2-11 16]MCP3802242.1 hypothetical protein [Allokutzneria sp. A3M-2-11 16]